MKKIKSFSSAASHANVASVRSVVAMHKGDYIVSQQGYVTTVRPSDTNGYLPAMLFVHLKTVF
ncbi:hypothetical protein QE369_001205 [Agrobacterium larrymoorei]|uniref:Uncharacterized protein n=1 Tax=Agrobacterium larrymoorei TaxID=160699 RepID=A0AAJ2BAL2_9HYPH|nr:hypothetical protein [Agrobacterium larrymoorei]